jgi:hypothetical protein
MPLYYGYRSAALCPFLLDFLFSLYAPSVFSGAVARAVKKPLPLFEIQQITVRRQTRLALTHVILAANIEGKYASEASGMSLFLVKKSVKEAHKRYEHDWQFRVLCNAIAG